MGASDLPVGRWGNSLAVRIPARLAKELGVDEGSVLSAEVIGPGAVRLGAKRQFDMVSFLARLKALHAELPITEPTVEKMRRSARY